MAVLMSAEGLDLLSATFDATAEEIRRELARCPSFVSGARSWAQPPERPDCAVELAGVYAGVIYVYAERAA